MARLRKKTIHTWPLSILKNLTYIIKDYTDIKSIKRGCYELLLTDIFQKWDEMDQFFEKLQLT